MAVTDSEADRKVLEVSSGRISKLHYLTHDDRRFSHSELARLACEAGVRWIQFRMKNGLSDEIRAEAKRVQAVCREHGAIFIVNDRVSLAYELGADGVHLGAEDMPWKQARDLLGPDAIIGGTANTKMQALDLLGQPVDYMGLGPLRFTDTKKKIAPLLGFEEVGATLEALAGVGSTLPVLIIGGVQLGDVGPLMKLGAHGVAVSAAIGKCDNPASAANDFVKSVLEEE